MESFDMAGKQRIWVAGDRERRQRTAQEVQQLRQMSKTLRTTAMRSFMERLAAERRDIKRPEVPVKPTSVAA
jgi:hypothetical protein